MSDAAPESSESLAATVPAAPAAVPPSPELMAQAQVHSSARWFWWIAGLSVINSVMAASGSDSNFVMGLGFTAVVDALFDGARLLGYALDLLAVGFFVGMGLLAMRGKLWAFSLGMVAYLLDGLIYLAVGDWMPVAFHALALYFIGRGAVVLVRSRPANSR